MHDEPRQQSPVIDSGRRGAEPRQHADTPSPPSVRAEPPPPGVARGAGRSPYEDLQYCRDDLTSATTALSSTQTAGPRMTACLASGRDDRNRCSRTNPRAATRARRWPASGPTPAGEVRPVANATPCDNAPGRTGRNGTSTQNRSEPPPSTWSPLPAMPVLSSHAPSLSGTSMARWPPPGMLVERTPTRDQPYAVDLEPVPLPQTFAPPRSSATIHSLRTPARDARRVLPRRLAPGHDAPVRHDAFGLDSLRGTTSH